MRLDLIVTRGIYILISTSTSKQNSVPAAEASSLKISSQEYISGDLKDHPSQHKNSHMMCIEKDHTLSSLQKRSEHDQNFSMKGKPL